MILYNFKYRGPYEYEKFILNIYQFLNEMTDIQNTVEAETSTGLVATADALKKQINQLLEIDLELACARERSLEL
jgi:hypothetical protein